MKKAGIEPNILKNQVFLADEVFRLVNEKGRLERLSESATVWSKNFSWEKSQKMSLDLIEKIVLQLVHA